MPNDAKIGLVVGLALVVAVSATFFRKETFKQKPEESSTAAAVQSPDGSAAEKVAARRE